MPPAEKHRIHLSNSQHQFTICCSPSKIPFNELNSDPIVFKECKQTRTTRAEGGTNSSSVIYITVKAAQKAFQRIAVDRKGNLGKKFLIKRALKFLWPCK